MAAKQPNEATKVISVTDYRKLNERIISKTGANAVVCQTLEEEEV